MKLTVLGFLFFVVIAATRLRNPSKTHHGFNASRLIGREFTRHTLDHFLSKKPKLWQPQFVSHAKKQEYRRRLGNSRPTQKHEEEIARVRQMQAKNRSKNMRQEAQLPFEFDARERWPFCKSIGIIQSQSNCGSCWAVSSAAAISDRICISTNGERQPQLSATELISCCTECLGGQTDGCQSGLSMKAWTYFQTRGIVTGGPYGNRVGCLPYPFPPKTSPMQSGYHAPQCSNSCQNGRNFQTDKHYGSSVFYPQTIEEMQREIFYNGPITLNIDVYEDFLTYKSGIYYYTHGNFVGGHAVKALGWGEQNGVPYWIAANLWGEEWGERGTFRIVRGRNERKIEQWSVGGGYDYARSSTSPY